MSWREWFGAAPSREDFASRMLRALRAEGTRAWTHEEAADLIRSDDGMQLNLGNLYLKYAAAPRAQRRDCLRQFVAMAHSPSIPKLWTMAERKVFPLLRSRHEGVSQRIAARTQGEQDPMDSAQQPLLEDLVVKLGYDFGEHVAHVSRETLDTWGRAPAEVHAAALRNLAALDGPHWEALGPSVHRLHSDASYAETMMLLERVIDALPYAARAVCCPSNRGILFAADAQDEQAVATLVEAATQSLLEEPWPISGTLCRRSEQGWRMFEPPAALAAACRGLAGLSRAQVYDEQREALESEHQATGRDVYVAKVSLIRREGALESYSVWSEGVPTLLPESDLVGFHREGSERGPILVPWADVQRLAGHRMRAEPEDPPRWFVDSFPDAQELGRLADAAI